MAETTTERIARLRGGSQAEDTASRIARLKSVKTEPKESQKLEGIENSISKFLFPTASKYSMRSPTDLKNALKQIPSGVVDVLNYPTRAIDYATSLGGRTTGTKEVREVAQNAVPDILKPTVGMVLDPGTYLGLGAIAKGAKAPFVKGTDGFLEQQGKAALRSGMKITDTRAKMAGRNVEEGAKKIIDDVAKYKVESPLGGFKGIAKKSQAKIDESLMEVDKIIDDFSVKNPNAKASLFDEFKGFIDEVQTGKLDDFFGDEQSAAKAASDLYYSFINKGLDGDLTLKQLNEAKKLLGKRTFKKGPFAISADPIKDKVKEVLNLRLKQKMETMVPEIRKANQTAHDLVNVKLAALEAAKRTGNRRILTGFLEPSLATGGAVTSIVTKDPTAAVGAAALLMLEKGLSKGRGASAAISLGRKTPNITKSMAVSAGLTEAQRERFNALSEDDNQTKGKNNLKNFLKVTR